MKHPISIAVEKAQSLAQRIQDLAYRIEGDDCEIDMPEPGEPIPLDVIQDFCKNAGLTVPAELTEAIAALPVSYYWDFDLSDYGVVDYERWPVGLHGGLLWFNSIADGNDYRQDLELANQYNRPQHISAIIPFIDLRNGDVIAVSVDDGTIWYLGHGDPEENSSRITDTLADFLQRWPAVAFPVAPDLLFPLFAEDEDFRLNYLAAFDKALAANSPIEEQAVATAGLGSFDPGFPAEVAKKLGKDHPLAKAAQQAQDNLEKTAPGFINRQSKKTKQNKPKKKRWWPF